MAYKTEREISFFLFSLFLFKELIMTQSSTDDSDRKEAAKFYSKWMNGGNKDENWDEVCLQWCKQQSAARKDQKDPNCSMLCFRSPTTTTAQDTNQLSDEKSWNPLKGYSVLVVNGKEGCVSHIDGKNNK